MSPINGNGNPPFCLEKQLVMVWSMEFSETIRRRLQTAMDARGWEAKDLAVHSGVRRKTIYAFLNGQNDIPTSENIAKLERALGVSLAQEVNPSNGGRQSPDGADLGESPGGNEGFSPRSDSDILSPNSGGSPRADAIDLRVLEKIPLELEGPALLAAIRERRYGRVGVDADSNGSFVVRLPEAMGGFEAGRRIVVNPFLDPVEGEIVLARARGMRQFGIYSLDDEKAPTLTLWAGGSTKDFDVVGTAVDALENLLKRPR